MQFLLLLAALSLATILGSKIQNRLITGMIALIALIAFGLSFLGLGTGEGYADWGQLLSNARNWIPTLDTHWWIVVYPGAALILFVLAFNLIGDAFRDALDPRMMNLGK